MADSICSVLGGPFDGLELQGPILSLWVEFPMFIDRGLVMVRYKVAGGGLVLVYRRKYQKAPARKEELERRPMPACLAWPEMC